MTIAHPMILVRLRNSMITLAGCPLDEVLFRFDVFEFAIRHSHRQRLLGRRWAVRCGVPMRNRHRQKAVSADLRRSMLCSECASQVAAVVEGAHALMMLV